MQQYTVPQFIDVEAKIIGPITTRQFLIFLAAALIIFISFKVFDFGLFLTVAIVVFLVAGTFAFLKVNGRPFHYFVLNLVQTLKKPSTRVWNHQQPSFEEKENKEFKFEEVIVNKKLNEAQLAELSLIIDTKGKYQGDEGNQDIKNL
ncbi:MAG: PrgI family protein [Candidatus Falkowbacteria bacterium]